MKLLIDMNLSPSGCDVLRAEGWDSVHVSDLGMSRASDAEIMARAKQEDRVLLTNDLDFSAILASTKAAGPSVVQLRSQRLLPNQAAATICSALRQCEAELEKGAIVTVDAVRSRVRVLPLP